MIQAYIDNPLYSCWPFWVLELSPNAQVTDVEKAAREITAKISFGIAGADEYATPTGIQKRDEFLIREAKSALQDAKKRLLAEFWYIDPNTELGPQDQESMSVEQWQEALGVKFW